jgi:hypothetical protein
MRAPLYFQPAVIKKPDRRGNMQRIGSGEAFKEFVKAFYPDPSAQRCSDVADVLCRQLRNPFAHALGVLRSDAYQLETKKVHSTNATTPGDGLTQAEVTALEESLQRPGGVPLAFRALVISGRSSSISFIATP